MSLTADDIDDIKQLLAANNAVLLTEFRQELEERLEEKLKPIHQKVDDLADFVKKAWL